MKRGNHKPGLRGTQPGSPGTSRRPCPAHSHGVLTLLLLADRRTQAAGLTRHTVLRIVLLSCSLTHTTPRR
jgi:hypothetical protein